MKSAPDSVPEASASNPRSQRPLADPSRWARPPAPAAAATPSWRISADPSPASRLRLTSAASPDRLAVKLNWAPPAAPSAVIESSPGALGSADHACSVALAGESASARAASQRLAPPGATRPTKAATSSSFSASRLARTQRPFGPRAALASTEAPPSPESDNFSSERSSPVLVNLSASEPPSNPASPGRPILNFVASSASDKSASPISPALTLRSGSASTSSASLLKSANRRARSPATGAV